MKVKLQRMSGLPADPDDAIKFDNEFRTLYLEAEKRHAKSTNEDGTINLMSIDMLSLQADVAEFEAELGKKYSIQGEVEWPKDVADWQLLISKYQSCIMLAPSRANPGELVLVIMDVPLD